MKYSGAKVLISDTEITAQLTTWALWALYCFSYTLKVSHVSCYLFGKDVQAVTRDNTKYYGTTPQ